MALSVAERARGAAFTMRHYARTKARKLAAHNRPQPLVPYLQPFITGPVVSILDAGSGPLCTIGTSLPGVEVRITCCDVLASAYRELYPEAAIPVEYQRLEALTYADQAFDVVHCANALDHTLDPLAAVQELQRVARRVVYLRHAENEGEAERYTGFHQWNIDRTGRIWAPGGTVATLPELGFTVSAAGKWVTAIWERPA